MNESPVTSMKFSISIHHWVLKMFTVKSQFITPLISNTLLESKIQSDTAYKKQLWTLIVWTKGDNYDLALSFQKRAGCGKICAVQGKDPSVHFAHNLV